MSRPRRLPRDFSRNAGYPLYAIDLARDRGWVLHFEPDDYRRASFLDQRALHHREISGWELSRAEVEDALQTTVAAPRGWLFHIGHCGSTLVSRLLDLIPGTLGLREPLPLLTLAHGRDTPGFTPWLPIVTGLLGRGFADTTATLVKPTSLVTTLADRLLPGSGPACLLWVDLHTWLASMLREDALKDGVLDSEPLRLRGFEQGPLAASGDAQRLARAWVIEQIRWHRLGQDTALPTRCDLDFADVLADPAGVTARLASHYGLTAPADWERRIADSGLLQRYAKDDAQAFDADVRQRELTAAAARHADALADGLRWAEAALRAHGMDAWLARLRPRV